MKKYIFILLTTFVAIALYSCEDEKNSIPPTFKGFTVSPNPAHPGDTVRVKLYYADKGEYIYGPRCAWNMKLDTLLEDGSTRDTTMWNYVQASISADHLGTSFILPKTTNPGIKTCNVEISFNNSVDTKKVTVRDNVLQPGYEGKMGKSAVTSLLYSKFTGSVNVRIVNP